MKCVKCGHDNKADAELMAAAKDLKAALEFIANDVAICVDHAENVKIIRRVANAALAKIGEG